MLLIYLGLHIAFPQKAPSTSFPPVTSINVEISPKNFLTFSFNTFDRLSASISPKLLNLNQDHPSKMCFFWSNLYKNDVTITSLIQMLELPNFGHMTISIT